MNVEMARQGRKRALSLMNSDRVLVRAARSGEDVVMPEKSSIDARLLTELQDGLHIKQIMIETGWSSSRAMEQLYKVAKKACLGIERRKGVLYLMCPDGVADDLKAHFAEDGADKRERVSTELPERPMRIVETETRRAMTG